MKLFGTGSTGVAILAAGLLAAMPVGVRAQSLDFETIGGRAEAIPAPQAGSQIKQLTPQQVVSLGSGGVLPGSVSIFAGGGLQNVPEGLPVLLIRGGRVMSATKTDSRGKFSFRGISAGVYTVMAAREDVLSVMAVTVVPSGGSAEQSLDLVAVTDMPLERSMSILAGLRRGVSLNEAPEPRYEPDGGVAMGIYRVVLSPTGGFSGYLSIPGIPRGVVDLSTMQVRVVRDGRIVAEAEVESDGKYKVDSVGPGPAGVVMFGPSGFAATGVEFVAGNLRAQADIAAEQFVSLQDKPSPGEFNMDLSPPGDAQAGLEEVQQVEEGVPPVGAPLEIPPPFAGGGLSAAGPGSGFGGGGGGPGGLGGIAGLAAIGATVAAALLAGDDDDGGFRPAPASPALP